MLLIVDTVLLLLDFSRHTLNQVSFARNRSRRVLFILNHFLLIENCTVSFSMRADQSHVLFAIRAHKLISKVLITPRQLMVRLFGSCWHKLIVLIDQQGTHKIISIFGWGKICIALPIFDSQKLRFLFYSKRLLGITGRGVMKLLNQLRLHLEPLGRR